MLLGNQEVFEARGMWVQGSDSAAVERNLAKFSPRASRLLGGERRRRRGGGGGGAERFQLQFTVFILRSSIALPALVRERPMHRTSNMDE